VVQTQSPELVVATTHTHSPHGNVGGKLGVGRLATKLIPAISSSRGELHPNCTRLDLIDVSCHRSLQAHHVYLLLLLTPGLLASTGCPAFVQRITGDTCSNGAKTINLRTTQHLPREAACCVQARASAAKDASRRLVCLLRTHPWLTKTPERSLGAKKEGEQCVHRSFGEQAAREVWDS
jgi:hypothetical protein